MKTFVTVCITAMFMAVELIAGNMGLALGLPVFAASYFLISFGTLYGIMAAGIAGLFTDLIYAREYCFYAVMWVIIAAITGSVIRRFHRNMPFSPLAGGAVCGILINSSNCLHTFFTGNISPGPDFFSMIIFQAAGGMGLMLSMVLLFDAVNFRSNLPRFFIADSKYTRFDGGE